MIDAESYINDLISLMKNKFSTRLLYVGLQGSYQRVEATENSDIDVMVIIDKLSVSDLAQYRMVIESMDYADKSCGFICSKEDLANWNPLEICHVIHSTQDYYGELKQFVPAYTNNDIRNYIKLSVNNLYHELCHRYIHATTQKNISALPSSYKSVFFILQNMYYIQNNSYIGTKADLLPLLTGKDHSVLLRSIELNRGVRYDFHDSFKLLFSWCQETMNTI